MCGVCHHTYTLPWGVSARGNGLGQSLTCQHDHIGLALMENLLNKNKEQARPASFTLVVKSEWQLVGTVQLRAQPANSACVSSTWTVVRSRLVTGWTRSNLCTTDFPIFISDVVYMVPASLPRPCRDPIHSVKDTETDSISQAAINGCM